MSKTTKPCSFEADGVQCDRPSYCRGYCTQHYRQLTNGKPLMPLRDYNRQGPECLEETCHEKPHAHGYCKLHLNRVVRHGDPNQARAWNPGATCKAMEDGERCTEPVSAKGYCGRHYMRLQRTGSTELSQRKPQTCKAVENGVRCTEPVSAKGYCRRHYRRMERTGSTERTRQQYEPGTTCKVEENGERCGNPVKADGYCQTHYMRVRRTGDEGTPELIPQRKRKSKYAGETCKAEVDGKRCPRTPKARGWCVMHYHRWMRTGDPLGKWGLEPRKSVGYTTTDGYKMAPERRNKRPILEHRLVMEQIIGRPLRRFEEPHHKNGIRDDNTPGNLELWVKWRQPNGQRLSDLLAFIGEYYPQEMMAILTERMGQGAS